LLCTLSCPSDAISTNASAYRGRRGRKSMSEEEKCER